MHNTSRRRKHLVENGHCVRGKREHRKERDPMSDAQGLRQSSFSKQPIHFYPNGFKGKDPGPLVGQMTKGRAFFLV
jgi:hypothetical protein